MTLEKWRFLRTGFNDAYFNMALDEVLLEGKEKDLIPPTLRFYGWCPAAFSLGYSQDINAELNPVFFEKRGIDCVKRLTGGGIILHDRELTYSITLGEESSFFSPRVGESFRRILRGVMTALSSLGAASRFAYERDRIDNSSAFCFASFSS